MRWCNPWGRTNKNADLLFPARRVVTGGYLLVGLLIPYLLHPESADTWLFARSFFILYIPAFSALSFKYFFGNGGKKRMRLAIIGGVPLGLMLVLFGFACGGGDQLAAWQKPLLVVIGAVSLGLAVYLGKVTAWIMRKIYAYNHDEYADDEDFPIRFASFIVSIPLFFLAIAWIVFLANDPWLHAYLTILVSIIGLVVLLVILHPQRHPQQKETANPAKAEALIVIKNDSNNRPTGMSTQLIDRIEKSIRDTVEGEQLYLKAGFTKAALENRLGINRSYLTDTFRNRFISFYNYMNVLRMEAANAYAAENPQANQTDIAAHSGLGSTRSYTRAKKLYETGELKNVWKQSEEQSEKE